MDQNLRMKFGKEICEKILNCEMFRKAKMIFSFLSTEEEVDMSFFDLFAYEHQKSVAYPIIRSDCEMDAYLPEYYGAFQTNRYGIREPVTSKSTYVFPDRIDLVIVPMLGFDERGYRIGYGGGYYDRYLSKVGDAFKLGVCFQQGGVSLLPTDKTDIKMDAIFTEEEEYYF